MIPHVAHVYWGQDDLPFLRFLTLWSFASLNPHWTIKLHEPEPLADVLEVTWDTPEHRGAKASARSYRAWLEAVPNLEVVRHPASRYPEGLSQVHRSDLLRWEVLATEGGIWSDMDILWGRPMSEVRVLEECKAFVCAWNQGGSVAHSGRLIPLPAHSIGFLGSSPGAYPYEQAWALARRHMKQSAGEHYQALGNQLLAQVCPLGRELPDGTVNLSRHVVYPYSWATIREFLASSKTVSFRPETVGVHWYAGDPISTHYVAERVHEDFIDSDKPSGLFAFVRHLLARYPLPRAEALLSAPESGILTTRPAPLSSTRADGR